MGVGGSVECFSCEQDGDSLEQNVVSDKVVAKEVAEQLASRGVTVRQLLDFCTAKKIKQDMLTKHVVRDIILPETAGRQSCYMASEFMLGRGGPSRSKKLVSHAWSTSFSHTVLNVVLDATGWSAETLMDKSNLDTYEEPDLHKLRGELEQLDSKVLESVYWLDVFAVNQHSSLCGDCFSCSKHGNWSKAQYAADECVVCKAPKEFPCPCGVAKAKPGTRLHETDELSHLARLMESIVVSLDPRLEALSRLWVFREVGEAIRGVPVCFRLALELDEEGSAALLGGEWPPHVSACSVSRAQDSRMLLDEVDAVEGGREVFNHFVSGLANLKFGSASRLADVSRVGDVALARLEHLEMDFQWRAEALTDLGALGFGKGHFRKLQSLQTLAVDLSCCSKLTDIAPLCADIGSLERLKKLQMNLSLTGVADVEALGSSLDSLKELVRCSIDLSGTRVTGMTQFGGQDGLGSLQACELRFRKSAFADAAGLASGLAKMRELQECVIDLSSSLITEVAALSSGLGGMKLLQRLTLNCNQTRIADVAPLSKAFSGLQALESCALSFVGTDIEQIKEFGSRVGSLRKLKELRLDFNRTRVEDLAGLGAGLRDLKDLRECTLDFSGSGLAAVSDIGQGLGCLSKLRQCTIDLSSTRVSEVTGLTTGLSKMAQLREFTCYLGNTRVDNVGMVTKSLGNLKELRKLRLYFSNTEVADLDGLAKGLSWMTQLSELTLYVDSTGVTNIDAIGVILEKLGALRECTVCCTGTRVSDITLLCAGLGELKGLKELTLDFTGTRVSDLTYLGFALDKLKALEKCTLYFSHTGVRDLGVFGPLLGSLEELKWCTIDFSGVPLSVVDPLAEGLGGLQQLKELSLDFSNTRVMKVDELVSMMGKLSKTQVRINVERTKVSSEDRAKLKGTFRRLSSRRNTTMSTSGRRLLMFSGL